VEIREIVKDSLSYPLTNWKSYLILGVILIITSLYIEIWWSFYPNTRLPFGVIIVELVTGILSLGYLIKIFKSTLDCENVLPKFNGLLNIIVDGFKGILVIIIYAIPFSILFLGVGLFLRANGYSSNDIFGLTTLLMTICTVVIIPIITLSLANMAFEGKLSSAFSFSEIRDDIDDIGWGNFIALYFILGIIYISPNHISTALNYLLGWIDPFLIVTIIKYLIIIPYLYIFATRTFAVIYRSSVV